jgi:ABC-type polysaccharide/polyol phosphate transport system ATPase subunit
VSTSVVFEGVGKRYRRGRERINLRAALPGALGNARRGDFHWALKDMNFTLSPGQSLGFIGPNGAGKSTTLKLVAGVISPTEGNVTVRGRTASLIELGAGFHPDMTGRENLYFSAAVLGMGPKVIRDRFDQIVDFADIGAYLDSPVKRYSSGMMARLGFSVATHLDAEVLVLDEVLAVGDANFQRKCHQRIRELKAQGVALLYVTHSLWTLPMLCEEAILLSNGTVASRGKPTDVVADYERLHQEGGIIDDVVSRRVFTVARTSGLTIAPGGSVDVDLEMDLAESLPDAAVIIQLADAQLKVYSAFSSMESGVRFDVPGHHTLGCRIGGLPLQPGSYDIFVHFVGDHRMPGIDDMRNFKLEVTGDPVDPRIGVLRVPFEWRHQGQAIEGQGEWGKAPFSAG